MTADGTELISAEILPIKPKQRAITAAPPDDKDAEYSCDGQHANVFSVSRCRRAADQGSEDCRHTVTHNRAMKTWLLMKSCPTTLLSTIWWPICSDIVTNATGTIAAAMPSVTDGE